MLYYLFEFLEKQYQFPGASLFGFLTFRASLAIITSLLIATVFGKKIIEYLQLKQIGETVRDQNQFDHLENQLDWSDHLDKKTFLSNKNKFRHASPHKKDK